MTNNSVSNERCLHLTLTRQKDTNIWWCEKCVRCFQIDDVTFEIFEIARQVKQDKEQSEK